MHDSPHDKMAWSCAPGDGKTPFAWSSPPRWREARTSGTATTSKSRFGGGFRNTQRTQWNVEVPAEPPGTDPRDEGRLGRSL